MLKFGERVGAATGRRTVVVSHIIHRQSKVTADASFNKSRIGFCNDEPSSREGIEKEMERAAKSSGFMS